MKLKEAIVHCDEIIKKMDNCDCRKEHEELKEFLEELQKYRDTGLTTEQIRELKERDTAKAPQLEGDGYANGEMVYDEWICPNCGEHYEVDYDDYDFCPNCGQRLKWEE